MSIGYCRTCQDDTIIRLDGLCSWCMNDPEARRGVKSTGRAAVNRTVTTPSPQHVVDLDSVTAEVLANLQTMTVAGLRDFARLEDLKITYLLQRPKDDLLALIVEALAARESAS